MTTDAIGGLRTLKHDPIHGGDMRLMPPHYDVRGVVMRLIESSRQRLLSRSRGTALARFAAAVSALTILSLSACSDTPLSPAERHPAANSRATAVKLQHRPFQMSQTWDASGNDFTVPPCVAAMPDPAHPGSSIQIVISGLLHTTGTATHFGRYTADTYATQCTWNVQLGAVDVRGDIRTIAASGDTVWGTFQAYATFSATGADFAGIMTLQGGTGRFQGATGVASIYSHDEADGSGTGWGSGWIAY